MTDKQIIIDGIDVSGCPYYCGHDICKNTCHYFSTPCEWVDVQNCTYKQFIQAEQTVEECHKYQAELEDKLTAKEQECEELKKIINEAKNSKLDLKSFLVGEAVQNEYEQQLDQLKMENEELKKILTDGGLYNLNLMTEKRVLLQTLTEIKEIAEDFYLDGEYCKVESLALEILRKISEVEND